MKIVINQSRIEMIRVLRNPYYLFWSLAMPIVFYIVFTKIFDVETADKEVWAAHYLMSMTVFSVMGSSIMTMGIRLVEERSQGWTRYMRVTPLSDFQYFSAKMFGQTVVHVCSIVVIFTAGILFNGVRLSIFEWLFSASWILLASLPFLAIGSLVGTMKRVDTAIGISNVLYLLLAVTGGLWMPIDVLPKVMQNISMWLPAYHFGNGAWEIVRGQLPELQNILILVGYLVVFMVLSMYIRRKQDVV